MINDYSPPSKLEQHWLIELLDELRKKHRISARKFSIRMGYSPTFWTGFVKQQEHPLLHTLDKALEILKAELKVEYKD